MILCFYAFFSEIKSTEQTSAKKCLQLFKSFNMSYDIFVTFNQNIFFYFH